MRRKKIQFDPVDPLGDGLREAIEAEQRADHAIDLHEELSSSSLTEYWAKVTSGHSDYAQNMSLFELVELD